MTTPTSTAHIGIVGAGVAGLCTAQLLRQRGLNTTLFDKGRGLGGRLARRQTNWANLDIGAPFFHLSEHAVNKLQGLAPGLALQALPWQQQTWRSESGFTPPESIDSLYATAANSNRLCHGLAQGLSLSLAAPAPAPATLTLETLNLEKRVTEIRGDDRSVTLWDDAGNTLGTFDAVVIAVPADQCAALLPETLIALTSHHMVPRWTLQLELAAATPLLASANIVNFEGHPVLERLVNLSALPGRDHRHCIQLCLEADYAATHERCSDQDIFDTVSRALSALAPLPRVANWELQRWRLGGSRCGELETIADPSRRVVIAGDWSAGGNQVDAALRSAERACSAVDRLL